MSHPRPHPALELLHGRISADRFDAARPLSEDEIRQLVEDAVQAPSSFNIQHWRFVAVREAADKKRLRAVAFDQAAVEEAGVTFIVLGDLLGHERLPEILEGAVRAGTMSRPSADRWIESARRIYADHQAARDEAIRSASLAAMALMIAAAARGFASGPLIGFDPGGVRREFAIADRFLPVMLLCVGAPLEREARRRSRLGVDQVLSFDRGREF